MNIYDFTQEFGGLTTERKRKFANKVMNEITKKINQEYSENGTSEVFEKDFLPILLDLEEFDYFGTEGFDG